MEIQSIPLAAHENDMARNHKVIKWLIIGWAVSVIILSSVVYYLSFGYETTTTTTTEETWTTENTSDSGDGGVAYSGSGDLTVGYGEQQDDVHEEDDHNYDEN